MSAKRIYVATVTYEFDMYVVADDEGDAGVVAMDYANEALREYGDEDAPSISLRPANAKLDGKEQSCPYGDDEKTVAKYVAEQVEREREAEEQCRIDANQLKLFPVGGA